MLKLSDSTFKNVISGDKPVVVDFFATWCGPCKAMAPSFDKLSESMSTVATFAKVDIEECSEVSATHDIQAVPTLVLFKKGIEVSRKVGMVRAAELETWIKGNV